MKGSALECILLLLTVNEIGVMKSFWASLPQEIIDRKQRIYANVADLRPESCLKLCFRNDNNV